MWPLVFLLLHTLPVCWFAKTVKLGGFSGEVCRRKFARGVGLKVFFREGPFLSMRRSLRRKVGKISFPFVSLFQKNHRNFTTNFTTCHGHKPRKFHSGGRFPHPVPSFQASRHNLGCQISESAFWIILMQCISEGSSLLGHTFLWLQGLCFFWKRICGSTI